MTFLIHADAGAGIRSCCSLAMAIDLGCKSKKDGIRAQAARSLQVWWGVPSDTALADATRDPTLCDKDEHCSNSETMGLSLQFQNTMMSKTTAQGS